MTEHFIDKPLRIAEYGTGKWLFRYELTPTDGGWKSQTVVVEGQLTEASVLRALIAERWDITREIKLINDYNAAQVGLVADKEAAQTAYAEYLAERARLKEIVDDFFNDTKQEEK